MAPPFRLLVFVVAALLAACSDSRAPAGAAQGGDFILRSPAGAFDTQAMRGKVLLLFFGYTYCPDVCPTFLATGAQALNRLTAEERRRVRLVFVSVDPERDAPQVLAQYTAYFHPDMLGVTGTPAEVAAAAKLYDAHYVRQPPRPDGSYAVDHSTQTYVVGANGKLVAVLDLGTPVGSVVEIVRKLL